MPMPTRVDSGNPTLSEPSTTAAGFTNFMLASSSRNRAGRPPIIQLAQSRFFEDAVCVEYMDRASGKLSSETVCVFMSFISLLDKQPVARYITVPVGFTQRRSH